jgi:hypothetical protein
MSVGLSFAELLTWNDEASAFWKKHLETHSEVAGAAVRDWRRQGCTGVREACMDGGSAVGAAAGRCAGDCQGGGPGGSGPDAVWTARTGIGNLSRVADAPGGELGGIVHAQYPRSSEPITMSRRKVMGHALLHGQRHWAQLATLVRNAGFPSDFRGDFLFSKALR